MATFIQQATQAQQSTQPAAYAFAPLSPPSQPVNDGSTIIARELIPGTRANQTAKLRLFCNLSCPYSHRALITLNELGLEFERVLIEMHKPREQWYLDINPRGVFPSLEYEDDTVGRQIIIESHIVIQFLADLYPSHLLPLPQDSRAALMRTRIAFFIDTWSVKLNPTMFPILFCESDQEKEQKVAEVYHLFATEIEPLLADANPFFGGSSRMTLVEAAVAPFLIRSLAMTNGQLLPTSFRTRLDTLPNLARWARVVLSQESVTRVFDPDVAVRSLLTIIARMKSQGMSKERATGARGEGASPRANGHGP